MGKSKEKKLNNEKNNEVNEKKSGKKEEKSTLQEENKALKEKIEKLQLEIDELNDRRIRTAAEFENFRRRSNSEKTNWIKNATERLALEICEVLDNFERALNPEKEFEDIESFRKGVKLIYNQLQDILKKEGVQKIEALGKNFDPNYHDALAHIPSELAENKVAAVIQNGYTMNEKVIRAAKVAVSNGQKPEQQKKSKKEEKKESKK
ncbi:MAG: nucleotide exchange factor GrpE [Candidatus Cloacimonadota bacterium]|nr:nucleotide exchange factor GrpE [Candidatus Cloacimonadota bacterium]